MIQVFVYGTLKQGWGNNRLLPPGTFLRKYTTEPLFTMWDIGGLPALTRGADRVLGELYEIDGDTLSDLDRLEGHPHFYQRTLVDMHEIPTVVYLMADAEGHGRRVIPHNIVRADGLGLEGEAVEWT